MKIWLHGIGVFVHLNLLTGVSNAKEHSPWILPQPQSHPCQRPCVLHEAMTCNYKFEVDQYYALGKACYDCPTNMTDCYRKDCVTLDGVARTILTANRQLPGPSIEVCLGDKIVVHVVNKMEDKSTTIHWHGWHQVMTPHMDGVPFITQCPIYPNSEFRYVMNASTAGTHFWHSHAGVQRMDGLFGPLVVRTPPEHDEHYDLYDVDHHVVIVNDWSHSMGVDKQQQYYQVGGLDSGDSFLINGRGRYYNDTVALTHTPLTVITVKHGLRYRIRFISAAMFDCMFQLYIDNHNFTAIATDGKNFRPVRADALIFYGAERWDIILEANQTVGNYWIRIQGKVYCDLSHQLAILHYEGASLAEPEAGVGINQHPAHTLEINSVYTADMNREKSVQVSDLVSCKRNKSFLKEKVNKKLVLGFDFYEVDNPLYHLHGYYGFKDVINYTTRTPQMNHVSFKYPSSPLLSQYDDIDPSTFCSNQNLSACAVRNTTLFCECTNVVDIPRGSVVELILVDRGTHNKAVHPFHLHGYSFAVLAMERLNDTTTVEAVRRLDEEGGIHRNLVNPVEKDTIAVPHGGYAIIRFKADNVGIWFFHCHLELHMSVGMSLAFKVGEFKDMPKPPVGFPTCGNFYNNGQ